MSRSQKDSKFLGDLLVLGDLCLDIDVYADYLGSLPRRASRIRLSEGGSAGNVAFMADRLGLTTGLAAPICNDNIGKMLESLVKKSHERVNFHPLRNPKQLTCAIVNLINRHGARRAYYQKNEGNCKLENLIDIAQKYRNLHMSGYALELFDTQALHSLVKELKNRSKETTLDLFPRIGLVVESQPQISEILQEIDLLFGNLIEFRAFTGSNTLKEITQYLADMRINAIIKMGSKGALYIGSKGKIYSPSKRVKPRSLKGAGDVFIATFLASHLRGHTIKESLDKANIQAGMHVAGETILS